MLCPFRPFVLNKAKRFRRINERGLTLIELLIVLAISSVLIAAIYRTFVHQQHSFTVQEQVVDMQQNVRIAINQMVREIRMAGFGRPDAQFLGNDGMHGRFKNIVTPSDDGKSITVVGAFQEVTTLKSNAMIGSNSIEVHDVSSFDIPGKFYISINGTESHRIHRITGNQLHFFPGVQLRESHFSGEPVFLILAITYSLGEVDGKICLMRSDNLPNPGSAIPQPIAENIEFLQFSYTLSDGTVFLGTVPGNRRDEIRMVQVEIRARTDQNDPQLTGGNDGFRRRTLVSNIQLRNLSF